MTATENVGNVRLKNAAKKNPGHRYAPGHPHYPRKHGSRSQATAFRRRSAKIFAAIVAERGGSEDLTVTQLIHAQNAADLGASLEELKDRRKAGEFVDPIAVTNLANAQRRSLAALDE
jgi:hypothetical protein